MNKSEKEHLCQRIKEITNRKLVKEKVKEPSFNLAILDAANAGKKLKLLPNEVIARNVAMAASHWRARNFELSFHEIFERPMQFDRQLQVFKIDQEFVKRKNAPLLEKMRDLIDRIMLGVVKNPEAALAEAEGWKP